MSARAAVLLLGLAALGTAAMCASMVVAAPRVFRRMRRRYGCVR